MLLSNFNMKLVNFKGYCQGQKGPMWAYISETMHTMVNVYLLHIYKVIFGFSVYIMTFDLG